MALINCPECGREVSNLAIVCPGCGYAINKKMKRKQVVNQQNKTITIKVVASFIIVAVVVVFSIAILITKSKGYDSKDSYSYAYSAGSKYSYGSNNTSKNNDSSIFRNLDIEDFSCYCDKYVAKMQCKVTNSYNYSVCGYFRVNFYDNRGELIYNHLMSLPDVAPGESVVCSTPIPKDEYPYDYVTVDFSQASLTTID